MEQWIKVAGQFGIPVVLLALAIYLTAKFVDKKLWPFVVKQIEDAKAERKTEMDSAKAERQAEITKFVDAIRARDVLMAEGQRENIRTLEAMTSELRALSEIVRNGKHR